MNDSMDEGKRQVTGRVLKRMSILWLCDVMCTHCFVKFRSVFVFCFSLASICVAFARGHSAMSFLFSLDRIFGTLVLQLSVSVAVDQEALES